MTIAQIATQWNVMISSRMSNFEPERQAAQRGISATGMAPWLVEDRPSLFSHITAPNDLCKSMAEQCDLFLLILGPTYGYQPDGQLAGAAKSATQMEYEWARARRPNKVLVFVREDALETSDPQQRGFISSVGAFNTGYTFTKFTTPEQLEELVRSALLERQAQESLDVSHYLEAVRDTYASLINPITGAEMDTKTTILLQLRTETEDRPMRRTWEEALGEIPRDIFHPLAQFKRFRAIRQNDPESPTTLASATPAPEVDSADHFLNKYGRFVLLGDPGAGKSTLLRRLTFSAVQRGLGVSSTTEVPAIPIYVTAVELGKALVRMPGIGLAVSLGQALREQGIDGADIAIEVALNAGRAIVFVDGLDEVALDEQRAAIFDILRQITGTNQAILAARPSAYQEGILTDWRICEVQQLDTELRLLLTSSVFQQITRQTGKTITVAPAVLKNMLDEREDLHAWAGNPLLLTLIASQYALNENLPRQRAVIYRLSLDRLIDSPYRQAAPRQQQIARDQLEVMLERLALRMMESSLVSAPLVIASEDGTSDGNQLRPRPRRRREQAQALAQPVDIAHMAAPGPTPLSEGEVRELVERSGVIQRQSGDQYGFIHLTFQEYFAARALAGPSISTEQRREYIVRRRLSARWEQVTLLLVSELDRRREQTVGQHEPEADVLVRALIEADKKPVKRLGGRDPLHLALIRATAAQRERSDLPVSTPVSVLVEARWSDIWHTAVLYRLQRFNDKTFGGGRWLFVYGPFILAPLLSGILVGSALNERITGILGITLAILAGLLTALTAVAVMFVATILIALVISSYAPAFLSFDETSYPEQSVTEERAGQEMRASNKVVVDMLKYRPYSWSLHTASSLSFGLAFIWVLILGLWLTLINLPFTATTGFAHWLSSTLPYGLLVLAVIALASAVLWRIALVANLRADSADRLIENRGIEDAMFLVEQLTSGRHTAAAGRALQRLGPAAAVVLPQIQKAATDPQNPRARVAALAVMGSMGTAAAPAIQVIIDAASANNQEVRIAAVTALAQLKQLELLDANSLLEFLQELVKQLSSTRILMPTGARDALIQLGPAAIPVATDIEALTRSNNRSVKVNANRVLEAMGRTSQTASSTQRLPTAATSAQKRAGSDLQVIKTLRRNALRGSTPLERREAVAALADAGPQKLVLRTLIMAMRDRDATVRVAAVDSIARLGPSAEPALPFLMASARDRAGALWELLLRMLAFLAIWPALALLVLQQLVVNRAHESVVNTIAFLPAKSHASIEMVVTLMKGRADFISFLAAMSIYTTIIVSLIFLRYSFCKRRHVVRDAAMRALPAFLANIEDVNA